jgi:hypothetical protein
MTNTPSRLDMSLCHSGRRMLNRTALRLSLLIHKWVLSAVLSIVALIAPIALAYYVSPERQRNRWNHQRARQAARAHQECQRNSGRDKQVSRVHDWINYKEKLHKSDMQPYAGFVYNKQTLLIASVGCVCRD